MSESRSENSELPVESPPELAYSPDLGQPGWEFKYSGLGTIIEPSKHDIDFVTRDGQEVHIPKGTVIADIRFFPYGWMNNKYVPGTRRPAIMAGMKALQGLLDTIGQAPPDHPDQPLPEPQYLLGAADSQAATFIERIGFHPIVDITGWGEVAFKEPSHLVVASNIKDMREAVTELKEKHPWLSPMDK